MEFYVFKIHLSHLKYITGVGKEHIASLSILCHILIFTFLESFQLCRIITFHPTSPLCRFCFFQPQQALYRLTGSQRQDALYSFNKRY